MKNTNYSIVIPFLFQKESDLLNIVKTINSILDLTNHKNYEIIIGFESNSEKHFKKFQRYWTEKLDIIKVINIQQKMGLTYTLNHCIGRAKSNYIARMDSGDMLISSSRFDKQIKLLKSNDNIWCVGSAMIKYDGNGFEKLRVYPEQHKKIKFFSYFINPIAHPTVMFKKDVFKKIGGYDESIYNEDFELWMRSIKLGYEIYNFPDPFIKYKITETSVGRGRNFSEMLKIRKIYLNSKFLYFLLSIPANFLYSFIFNKIGDVFLFLNKHIR